MKGADRDSALASLRKDLCDLAVCPAAPAQLVDQFAVRLKTRSRRPLWQSVEDFL